MIQFWYIIEESSGEWIVTGEKPKYSNTLDRYSQHWTSDINADWYQDDGDLLINYLFEGCRKVCKDNNLDAKLNAIPFYLQVNYYNDN